MNVSVTLPKEFQELAPFAEWAIPSSIGRVEKRRASSQDELKKFYATMTAYLDRIMDHLAPTPLANINAAAHPMYCLVLSLAEIAPYVEWYDGASSSCSDPAAQLPLVREPSN